MKDVSNCNTPIWTIAWISQYPIRFAGILAHLLLRTLFGIFWLAAGIHKIQTDWLSSDVLERMFFVRLTEMPPDAFAVFYLQSFAIPLYKLIAWIIVCGELYAAAGLLLGLTTRPAATVDRNQLRARREFGRRCCRTRDHVEQPAIFGADREAQRETQIE